MRRTVIVAVSALLALSACDTTSEPSAPPTSEDALTTATAEPPAPVEDAEVTTEPEPTSEEPTEEAAPMDQTEEGAQAFVEHYMDELNEAFVTGDGSAVRQLGTAECQSCSELVADAEANPAGEELFRTTVQGATLIDDKARAEALVEEAGESTPAVFELAWDAEWKVEAIKIGQR